VNVFDYLVRSSNIPANCRIPRYGTQLINSDMLNFAFQDSYMLVINARVQQEQLRLAAENKLRTVEVSSRPSVVGTCTSIIYTAENLSNTLREVRPGAKVSADGFQPRSVRSHRLSVRNG
jgi:hypothetical protein